MSIETQAFTFKAKDKLNFSFSDKTFPWVQIGKTERQQGWKIHLSCGPDQLGILTEKLKNLLWHSAAPYKYVRDKDLVMQLNAGVFGPSQIGKCITIYPADDQVFKRLCLMLVKLGDFGGPNVPDDLYLGGAVHVRYGAFNPVIQQNDFGQLQSFIRNENGTLVADQYSYDYNLRRFQRTFESSLTDLVQPRLRIETGTVLNDRYMVLGAIRQNPKGSIFQAIDMSEKATYRPVILKEGKSGMLRDLYGRDIQSRLKHQFKMHELAAEHGVAPKCDPYFETGTSAFLPIECMLGDDFEKLVQNKLNNRRWDCVSRKTRRLLLRTLQKVAISLSKLHGAGIIHRDLTPSNILMGPSEEVVLSDLEIASSQESKVPVYDKGTPGFMSLGQINGEKPTVLDDIYAYAALCLFTVTGLNPQNLIGDLENNFANARGLASDMSDWFWRLIELGLSENASERPALEDYIYALDDEISFVSRAAVPPRASMEDAAQVLHKGVKALVSPSLTNADGIWITPSLKPGDNADLQRSMHQGIAGVLYFLSDYAKNYPLDDEVLQQCQKNADWLISNRLAYSQARTGLHFGEAGVLLALTKAKRACLIAVSDEVLKNIFDGIVTHQATSADITHGDAGIALAFAEIGTTEARKQARWHLDRLCKLQKSDGSFILPDSTDGFAHGTAGVAYALAKLGRIFSHSDYLQRAEAAADYLLKFTDQHPLSNKVAAQNALTWCNGKMGMTYLFSELYQATGRCKYFDAIQKAVACANPEMNPASIGLCHGVAGNGTMLLDAGCVTLDARMNDTAAAFAATVLQRECAGGWVTDGEECASADLMTGVSGVLQFLLRFVTCDPNIGIPGCIPILQYCN